jgi:flagellar protein FliS
MKQYHEQAILSATPEELITKLYDLGIQACHRNDRHKLRRVLKELMSSLNFEAAEVLAQALFNLYEYCLNLSIDGDLEEVQNVLSELRDVWRSATAERKAA